ncbi:MAG: ATP-binding protein [Saprospiraceae bacterium]|nr:ATP-binding protein [Saprospiraceae bacterium]
MKLITEQDILELITNQIEESIHLDFKRGDGLSNNKECKRELAKDVSSFANSDGGTIIYGIEEINHVASKIVTVDGNTITKEWLEQVINTNINRRISEIVIDPIRIQGNITKSIYVVNIPRSLDAPHMTTDKRYYKRFNFESVQMEEYEIRDLYNRANFVNLEISEIIIESGGENWSPTPNYPGESPSRLQNLEFYLGFQIENVREVLNQMGL